jgi:hypothetical protein
MTDLFSDIETIQDVLIAWEEGASDEKRMARQQLRNMLARKQREATQYETDLEDMMENMPV